MENGSNGFAYTVKCEAFLDGFFLGSSLHSGYVQYPVQGRLTVML
jgi:hypothetical protein